MQVRAQIIALDPNNEQATYFNKCAGIARLAWNWALAEWNRQYESGEKPSAYNLCKQFNSIKRDEFPFVTEVPCDLTDRAITDLGDAWKRYFKKLARRPRFKSKDKARKAFMIAPRSGNFKIEGKYIRLPKVGWVKMHRELRYNGTPRQVRINYRAGRWFAAVLVGVGEDHIDDVAARAKGEGVIGVDLGLKDLAVLSDGTRFPAPKALANAQKTLQRRQRDVTRKVKGSVNRRKAADRVAKVHARVSNIRKAALHELTSYLVEHYSVIVIEDLNVSGMLKNRHLSRAISDAGFYEFRRQLEYKAEWAGARVVVADRFDPTSKTCSSCGWKNGELKLSEREWTCGNCLDHHDRDVNAAMNLRALGLAEYAAVPAVSACGEESAGNVDSGRRCGTVLDEAGTGLGREQHPSAGEKLETPRVETPTVAGA